MTDSTYHDIPGVSSHALITLLKSPAECWQRYLDPNRTPFPPTASMRLGTLIHCLALTPNQFNREFIVANYERRSHAGKDHYADLATTGLTVIKPAELEKAHAVVAALKATPEVRRLLNPAGGKKERTIIQPRPPGLLPLKGRLDVHDEARRRVVELKTIRDLGLIALALRRYRYPVSAAFYADLVRTQSVVFVFVQSAPPYEIAVIPMDRVTLAEGREQYQTALSRFDECWKSGLWPEAEPLPDFDDDPLLMPVAPVPTRASRRFDAPPGELAL